MSAGVTVLNAATGAPFSRAWNQPRAYGRWHGEATDLAVDASETAVVLSGHRGSSGGGIEGTMTRVSLTDGSRTWTRTYSVGGNPKLIFNECWGITKVGETGYAMACGAGIEGCPRDLSASDRADCRAGIGDRRPGAQKRGPAVWQSFVPRVDNDGVLLWQRVDSYKHPDDPDLGAPGFDPGSSAAEWIFPTRDGGLAVIQDEGFGIGLMKLAPE